MSRPTDPADLVTPAAPAPPAAAPATPSDAARSLPELVLRLREGFDEGTNLIELLRAAGRTVRRLVDCDKSRIWLVRRAGRRLVARDFPAGGGPPTELRMQRDEGLAGWVFATQEVLRLAPGDPRPVLRGPVAPFRSALVVPLFRRGEVFAAIECLDKQGGDAFSDDDVERLTVAAEHVGFALDNALLYEETERRALEKEVLLDVSSNLSGTLDLDGVIEAILKSLRQVVNYDAAAIYLVNRSTRALELVRSIGYPPGSEEAFGIMVGQGIVGWVAKTGEPAIVADVSADPRYVLARVETRSELAAPLKVGGRTIGVFNLERDLVDAYHEGHLELVTAFAAHAAIAVERARLTAEQLERRRLEKELAIAREIQASFLPDRAPDVPGFELAGSTQAHDEVGGDYYDFIHVSETRLGIAIADVSGKGIPAALIMAGFRMSLLAEIRNEFAIRAVMRKVNSLLHESTDRDKFVTAFYGVLDHRNGVLIFSNAGHNPPVLFRADGRIEYLEEGGVALGVLPEAEYDDRPIALRPGDVLVLYTDGVSESESPSGEHFGQRRIEQVVSAHRDRNAREIMDTLIAAVRDWAGERGPSDDLTLVVLRASPPPAAG
ncbi:MAG: SpoIIE family protein phosphatase [Candidatus Eisenbacteria bacterium]|nr:SpoIIE family protein phosphatase [Candidatus Eisenbacteria bacterium]